MAEIKEFYRQFVERSQTELKVYNGEREFTNLINLTFGLIIIPYESHIKEAQPGSFWDTAIDDIWLKEDERPFTIFDFDPIRGERDKQTGQLIKDDKTLKVLINKLRNGFAHANIEPVNENGKWTGVLIWNCTNPIRKTDKEAQDLKHCYDKDPNVVKVKDLVIGFTWVQLHMFANFIADQHLKWLT